MLGLVLMGTPLLAVAMEAVALRELPLLFADDSGIANREGLVRTLHPAHTRDQPVLVADQPWEGDRVYIYGSVYFDADQGRYLMWYLARPGREIQGSLAGKGSLTGLRHNGFDVVLYATSRDGVNWEKPAVGVHEVNGDKNNNVIFDVHSPSVLIDRRASPETRYKLLGSSPEGYRSAVSADGIHWRSPSPDPVLAHFDTITLAQDPRNGDYLAYHKRPASVRGFDRRVVWLSRSADFITWSEPELVLVPDETDDEWTSRPGERTEIYNMSVFPHAAGFIGMPSVFRVQRTRPRAQLSPGQSPLDGPLDIQLATSVDGRVWKRSSPRIAMIPRGEPGTFDAGALLGVASTTVDAGDETWVYYTAITTGHGGPIPPKRITIGRAEWRLHGFASLDAGPDGGVLQTVPLLLGSNELVLNADARRGQITYALCGADGKVLAGFDFADSEPLQADDTRWKMRWKQNPPLPRDQPVSVSLRLNQARLYSLAAASEATTSRP